MGGDEQAVPQPVRPKQMPDGSFMYTVTDQDGVQWKLDPVSLDPVRVDGLVSTVSTMGASSTGIGPEAEIVDVTPDGRVWRSTPPWERPGYKPPKQTPAIPELRPRRKIRL